MWLFIFVLSVLILINGGRLVSSDEVSMYLTVESICQRGELSIPVENAPNATIVGGKAYTWYEAGNILAGIPMYVAGKTASSILPLSESLKGLLPRTAVSLTGPFIGAWLGVLLFSLLRRLQYSVRTSLLVTLGSIFSTFMLWYFKMYLRESILALCLLGSFYYLLPESSTISRKRSLLFAGLYAGFGILTKLVFVINIFPLLLFLAWKSRKPVKEIFSDVILFSIPIIIVGIAGTGLYNYLRMGNPLDTGYTGGTSFPTPLYVGVYGLSLSPGKGIFWFAPLLLFSLFVFKLFWQKNKQQAVIITLLFIFNLILYAKYISWGGDGSWGPRYLAPLIPLLVIPVAYYLKQFPGISKKIALGLITLGCIVQLGGVSIYAGAYIREIGEFPYQKQFDDPEFLYKTHFVPNYSPVIGHWRMLTRNTAEHLEGNYPQLQFDENSSGKRLPVTLDDQSKLLHTLDFWFTYALYAGVSPGTIKLLLAGLILLCTVSGFMLRRSMEPRV